MVETVEVDAPPAPGAGARYWVVPMPGTRGCRTELSPPATNTSPPRVAAAAPASGTGSWPTTVQVWCAGSTAWITVTGAPAWRPVTASPPNTKIFPPSAATAG